MPTENEQQSKDARAEGVERMLEGEEPPVTPPTNDPEPPEAAEGTGDAGKSTTRHGEDIAAEDGKEPGRVDTGGDGTPADRPTGTSTPRDQTGVNPGE